MEKYPREVQKWILTNKTISKLDDRLIKIMPAKGQ